VWTRECRASKQEQDTVANKDYWWVASLQPAAGVCSTAAEEKNEKNDDVVVVYEIEAFCSSYPRPRPSYCTGNVRSRTLRSDRSSIESEALFRFFSGCCRLRRGGTASRSAFAEGKGRARTTACTAACVHRRGASPVFPLRWPPAAGATS